MTNEVANSNTTLSQVIQRIQREIQTLRETAHILTPMARTKIDAVALGKVPVLRVAAIDPDPEHGDVYPIRQLPGKFALSKVGLQRLEAIAGITGWTTKVEHINNDPLHVKATAYAEIEDIDGTKRGKPQTYELDLNDGSPQAKKMKEGELANQRANIVRLAESKAMNAVRRDLLNLQATFTLAELRKPFVIMRLVDAPLDASDPLIRKLLIMKQLNITSEMFDSAAASLPTPMELPVSVPNLQIPDTTSGSITVDEGQSVYAKMVERVAELYQKKVRGGRSANKPPLSELPMDELVKLYEILSAKPDIG